MSRLRLRRYASKKADPRSRSILRERLIAGRETVVALADDTRVHLICRTAVAHAKGKVRFQHKVNGRDARIWQALQDAGVSLRAVRG